MQLSWAWFVAMLSEFTFYAEQHQRLLCRWSRKCNPCRQGDEGKVLLSLAGERTHALRWMSLERFSKSIYFLTLRPRATFIPTIEVDGEQHRQWKLRDFFSAELCRISQQQVDSNLSTLDLKTQRSTYIDSTFRVKWGRNIAQVFDHYAEMKHQ